MNVSEAAKRIERVRELLLEMQRITSIDATDFEPDTKTGAPRVELSDDMTEVAPGPAGELQACWSQLQESVPPGFALDGNLVRHMAFNQATDWFDISKSDVPRELKKVAEYEKMLSLVEYLDSLHPQISRVPGIVLDGDIEAALRTVFSSLDSSIRVMLKVPGGQAAVPAVGKAFKDGVLVPPRPENLEGVRAYLQGVLGYYRSAIIHKPLPSWRNRLETSLSLFAVAHEAFLLLDACSRERK